MNNNIFHILLIEDNMGDARLIKEYLSDITEINYQIEHVLNLQRAITILAHQQFELIIADLGLPDSQGLDTYRKIYEAKPNCPVLILTGFDDERAAKEALREGAQDYITKSRIDSDILQKAINYSVERTKYQYLVEKSRQQFELAVKGSNDGIWDWDLISDKLYFSPQWKKMIGYEDHELKNEFQTFENHLHPDDKERVMDYVSQYLEGRIKKYKIDFRFRHKDGSYCWIMSRGEALRNEKGKPYRMAGSHTDVTERIQNKEKLHQQNKFLNSVIESISFPFYVINANDYTVEMANKTAKGDNFKPGMKCYELIFNRKTPCDKDNLVCPIGEAKKTGERILIEKTKKDGSGETKHIDIHAFPVKNEHGYVEKLIEYHVDVTQRMEEHRELELYRNRLEEQVLERTKKIKQTNDELTSMNEELDAANEELKSTNEALEEEMEKGRLANEEIKYQATLLKNVSDAIVSFNNDFIIQSWNDVAENLFNIPATKAIGQNKYNILSIEHVGLTKDKLYKEISINGYWKGEEIITLENGRRLYMLTSISQISDNDDEKIGYVAVYKNITVIKQYQEQLKEALEKERELGELKSGFVSLASHQFRTPLTTIQTSVELLEMYCSRMKHEDDSKLKKHLNRIQEEITRMNHIMDDVLILGRIEAGKTPFNPEKTDLVSFCQNIIHQQYLFSDSEREVVFHFSGQPYEVQVDQKLMHHIITNLLSNAIKYSKGNPNLSIHFQKDVFSVKVKDDGIGIPDEDQKNLFQSFFRARNTSGIPGTGLGLAIVKQFVEQHNGKVSCNSKADRGTEFVIDIPKAG